MAAVTEEGGAVYEQIGWRCACELCSLYSIELYLSLTTEADEQQHHPTLQQSWGNFRAKLESG